MWLGRGTSGLPCLSCCYRNLTTVTWKRIETREENPPLNVSVTLHSDSCSLLEFNNAFLFVQVHIRILPGSKQQMLYNYYPLIAGYQPLPQLSISVDRCTTKAYNLRRFLPHRIFVKVTHVDLRNWPVIFFTFFFGLFFSCSWTVMAQINLFWHHHQYTVLCRFLNMLVRFFWGNTSTRKKHSFVSHYNRIITFELTG